MCGIAGILSSGVLEHPVEARLRGMIGSIEHRGPDGLSVHWEGHLGLAHARLAVIDLATGDQPMTDVTGRYTIVYNGEIYNYQALRAELLASGVSMRTQSDTEVVLGCYAREGVAGFGRLRGMYAFALWDRVNRKLVLARDPRGIKPLFYARDREGSLLFGSEAKAILAGGVAATLEIPSLHLLMNFRYLPGENTLFRGIQQLAPGEVVVARAGHDSFERSRISERSPAGEIEVLDALRSSVQTHLTADVEVASYLSGGIDSAAIVAIARSVDGVDRTFSLPVGDDRQEAVNAARSAELLDVANICGDVPYVTETGLLELLWHLETPKVNGLQSAVLARLAAGHVKVALSGVGGDELFCGYNVHKWFWRLGALGRAPGRVFARAGAQLGAQLLSAAAPIWSEPERALLAVGALDRPSTVYGLLRNVWDQPRLRRWIYGPRMLDERLPDAFAWLEAAWPTDTCGLLDGALAFEWRHKMVNDLLWVEDRVSMAAGLEVRVPFVDAVVKASASRISLRRLLAGGVTKSYLREALVPVLPKEILGRPKSGFQIPAGQFFSTHLAGLADRFLNDEVCEHHGLFNPAFVKAVRGRPPAVRWRWHYFLLYLMLQTHLWLERFDISGPSALKKW